MQISLISVKRMRAEPSQLGTHCVGASLGGIVAVYAHGSCDTSTTCYFLKRCMFELSSQPSAAPAKDGRHLVRPTAPAATYSPMPPFATGGVLTTRESHLYMFMCTSSVLRRYLIRGFRCCCQRSPFIERHRQRWHDFIVLWASSKSGAFNAPEHSRRFGRKAPPQRQSPNG